MLVFFKASEMLGTFQYQITFRLVLHFTELDVPGVISWSGLSDTSTVAGGDKSHSHFPERFCPVHLSSSSWGEGPER